MLIAGTVFPLFKIKNKESLFIIEVMNNNDWYIYNMKPILP